MFSLQAPEMHNLGRSVAVFTIGSVRHLLLACSGCEVYAAEHQPTTHLFSRGPGHAPIVDARLGLGRQHCPVK